MLDDFVLLGACFRYVLRDEEVCLLLVYYGNVLVCLEKLVEQQLELELTVYHVGNDLLNHLLP